MAEIPNAPVKRLLIEGSHGCRISGSALQGQFAGNRLCKPGIYDNLFPGRSNSKVIKGSTVNITYLAGVIEYNRSVTSLEYAVNSKIAAYAYFFSV